MPSTIMKQPDELSDCDLQLTSETLAIAFSECTRKKSLEQDRKGSLISKNRSGKSLFRIFVKENSTSVWKPEFVKSILSVRFAGYLHDPPTLLLQGDEQHLQHIREAWSSRLLRPPAGLHIDFVGDVTRIGARPLFREHVISLCGAVCVALSNVTSREDVATQEAILKELERSFPGVHSPSRELLHETLGKLIRNRKVFCTGPGYHLVTTKTYSGSSTTEKESYSAKSSIGHKHCEECERNRSIFESQVRERRSYRVKKPNAETNTSSTDQSMLRGTDRMEPYKTVLFDVEPLHGSVVTPKKTTDESAASELVKSQESPERGHANKKTSNSIVEKMAEKLFRRRRKSSTPDHKKSDSAERTRDSAHPQVRELNKNDAIQLGYEVARKSSLRQTKSQPDSRSSSESPVKRHHSIGRKSSIKRRSSKKNHNKTEKCNLSHYEHREKTERSQDTPNLLKESQDAKSRKSSDKDETLPRKLKNEPTTEYIPTLNQSSSSLNNQFPKLRDAAVSCNLDDEPPPNNDIEFNNNAHLCDPKSPQYLDSMQQKEFSPTKNYDRRSLKRSKSLRLPRDHCRRELGVSPHAGIVTSRRIEHTSPLHNENQEYVTGMSYDTLKKSLSVEKMRRSVSSTSTSREYSYLHACHFAPSVRVGSVIADHLEELDRRRHFQNQSHVREMSPTSSLSSSLASKRSSEQSSLVSHRNDTASPRTETDGSQHYRDITSSDLSDEAGSNRFNDSEQNEAAGLDPETKAALEVAKRLAKLDIKMTREEWKEYFSSKCLPDHVEDALSQAQQQKNRQNKQDYPTTCFENTSGSVETVIDVKQKTKSWRNRNSEASNKSLSPSIPSVESDIVFNEQVAVNMYPSNSRHNTVHEDFLESEIQPYKCPDDLNYETQESKLCYTCDRGHQHLSFCNYNNVQLEPMDSASLTEDSGFHSARERNSLSSWETRTHKRGTFV
ncbi:uncharacterized protein LOC144429699 isoform X2 [Styela clava]